MKRRTRPDGFCALRGALAGILAGGLFLAAPSEANARDYRYGVSLGYGGLGIQAKVDINGAVRNVERSEGPLVAAVFVETLLSDTFAVSLEHARGVSLAPITTGVSLTGVSGKWYFFGPAPSMVESTNGGSTLFTKRWAPFAGVSGGIAVAEVRRDAPEPAPLVTGSGAFIGTRFGADYATGPGRGIRPELVYATSSFLQSFSTSEAPPTLSEFSLQCSWYFDF